MSHRLYYKVLHPDFKSGGIYNSKPVQYQIGKWIRNPEPMTNDPLKGGLFVLNKITDAQKLIRKRPNAIVCSCIIGEIYRQTQYLTKSNKIKLIERLNI